MNIDDRDEEVYEHKDLTKEPAVFKFYYAWKKFTMDKKVSEEISLILMLFLLQVYVKMMLHIKNIKNTFSYIIRTYEAALKIKFDEMV